MKFNVNDIFQAYNKVQDRTYKYKYLGVDNSCEDISYNIVLQNVDTGDIMHVENEWFNQRKITIV